MNLVGTKRRWPAVGRGCRVCLLAGVVMLGSAGCEGLNCGDAGCEDALVVNLTGNVPHAFEAHFLVQGREPQVIPCPSGTCPSLVSINETPAEVEVVLFGTDGMELARGSFTPQYETFQPNGAGCPPTCSHASVTLEIP